MDGVAGRFSSSIKGEEHSRKFGIKETPKRQAHGGEGMLSSQGIKYE
jgi:hypothetical protein